MKGAKDTMVSTRTDAKVGAKTTATPELRFPEFRDKGAWEVKRLGEVVSFLKGKTLSKSDIVENGKYKCIRYGELYTHYEEVINKVISKTNLLPKDNITSLENDVLIPSSGETQADIAKASSVQKDGIILGGDLNILRGAKSGAFLSYYINGSLRNKIAKIAQGNSVVHLYSSQLESLKISLPSLPEQQKIADCLTSLDELINAENEKLTALKDHKKGLLQKLFPAEGETTPELRFPEFRGKGAWEVKRLGEVVSFLKGKTLSKSDIVENGKYKCIRYGELYTHYEEVINKVISKTNLLPKDNITSLENDVLIPSSGETQADIAKASSVQKDGIILGGDLNILRGAKSGAFLSYYINGSLRNKIAKIAQGNSVVHLYSSQLESLKISLPSLPEQQKIADCLTSLDELISAQGEKLKALKDHKKGLMQQLFPSVSETTG